METPLDGLDSRGRGPGYGSQNDVHFCDTLGHLPPLRCDHQKLREQLLVGLGPPGATDKGLIRCLLSQSPSTGGEET